MKKGIIWSQKKMGAQRAKFSSPMRQAMKNEKVAKALDQSKERKEFYGMLKNAAEGGVSKRELQEISDKLAHGHEARTISNKEGRQIAEGLHEEFYSDRKKYKLSRPDFSRSTKQNTSASNSESKSANTGCQPSFMRYKPEKVPAQTINSRAKGVAAQAPANMASIMNRIRENKTENSENDKGDQLKGNFSQALAATRKNKRN